MLKIDPATDTVVGSVGAGQLPKALAFDGVYLWIANEQSGAVSKVVALDL